MSYKKNQSEYIDIFGNPREKKRGRERERHRERGREGEREIGRERDTSIRFHNIIYTFKCVC